MGRQSCCVKPKLRKGLWSPEEDEKLFNYINRFGVGCWSTVPKLAGLQRCGKSCRLRWINYLRPDLKRGMFSQQEEDLIISLHETLGNRWAQIATQLPGRTDNEIKNFWNSCLKKKLMKKGIDPNTHKPVSNKEGRDGENYSEKSSLPLPRFKIQVSDAMERTLDVHGNSTIFYETSREQSENKPIFDPLLLYEFQGSVDPMVYSSNFSTQYQQNLRPYEQNYQEGNSNSQFGINSMPSLTSFDHGNMAETGYSGNSTSTMSSFLFSEAKESSSNSSIMNNMMENAAFSWGTDKLEPVFQCQNGIKCEEMKPSPWPEGQLHTHNSEDYSTYPLSSLSEDLTGAVMGVFHQI